MAKKDVFQKASVEVASASRAASFQNAMKKCNLAAEFAKRGINIPGLDSNNGDNRDM